MKLHKWLSALKGFFAGNADEHPSVPARDLNAFVPPLLPVRKKRRPARYGSRTKQTLYSKRVRHIPNPRVNRPPRGLVVDRGVCPCQPESRAPRGGRPSRRRLPVVRAGVCTKCCRARERSAS